MHMKQGRLLKECLRQNKVSEQWNNGTMELYNRSSFCFTKKRDPKKRNNILPTHGLLCSCCHVFTTVITNRNTKSRRKATCRASRISKGLLRDGPPLKSQPCYSKKTQMKNRLQNPWTPRRRTG